MFSLLPSALSPLALRQLREAAEVLKTVSESQQGTVGKRDYCLAAYVAFDALVVLFVVLAGGFHATLTGYSVAGCCQERGNESDGVHETPPIESPSTGGETADRPAESEDTAPIGSVAVQKTASCEKSQSDEDSGGCADGTCDAGLSFAGAAAYANVPSTWGEQILLDGSPCTSGWPSHQGEVVVINGENYACDLFEVTDASLRPIAEEALDCCGSGCGPGCHDFCGSAYSQGLGDIKRCAGLYLIYGLGPARQWMQDYFAAEFACAGDTSLGCSEDDSYTCGCSGRGPSGSAMGLQCTVAAQPWASDADLSLNSCYLSDLPAHVNINVLSTGTCVDYSVSLTTLLRLAGFGPDEVYSVMGAGHEYNLVRLPGEARWNVVDTTENNPRPYNPSGLPHQEYPYCEYHLTSCANDAGQGDCPATEMIKGCGQ